IFSALPLATLTVRAIGKRSFQVLALKRAPPSWISYFVPGSSCTRLPRHSALRASNQSGSPSRHADSPAFLNWIAQPPAPGSAGGVQYTPIDSKVAIARGSAPRAADGTISARKIRRLGFTQRALRAGWSAVYRGAAVQNRHVRRTLTRLSNAYYSLEEKRENMMAKRHCRAYTFRLQGTRQLKEGCDENTDSRRPSDRASRAEADAGVRSG